MKIGVLIECGGAHERFAIERLRTATGEVFATEFLVVIVVAAVTPETVGVPVSPFRCIGCHGCGGNHVTTVVMVESIVIAMDTVGCGMLIGDTHVVLLRG